MTVQTLTMNQIIFPDMATLVGARRSSFMYLKGIKLTSNILNGRAEPVFLHMAIVQDRDNNNSDLDRRQNFFRDTTSNTTRAHPFNDWVSGVAYDYRILNNPINSDHYNVITHEVHTLYNKVDNAESTARGTFFKRRLKYYPIKRRIAFDNVSDEVNWRPFYICFWWQFVDPSDYIPTTGSTGVRFNYKADIVFKNIL